MANEINGTSEVNAEVSGEEQILQFASLLAAILGIETEADGPANKFKASLDLVATACSNTGNITKYIEELKRLESTLGGVATNVKNPVLTNLFNSDKNVSNSFSNLSSNFNTIDVSNFFSNYSKNHEDKDTNNLKQYFNNATFKEIENVAKNLSNAPDLGMSRKEAEKRIKTNDKSYEVESLKDLQNVARRLSNENPKKEVVLENLITNLSNLIAKFNIENPNKKFNYESIDNRNFDIIKSQFYAHKSSVAKDTASEKAEKASIIDENLILKLNNFIDKFNIQNPRAPFYSDPITKNNYDIINSQFSAHKSSVALLDESQKNKVNSEILSEKISQLQFQIQKFNNNPESFSKFNAPVINSDNYSLISQQFKTHKDNLKANIDNTPIQDWEAKDLHIKAARVGLNVDAVDIKTKGDADKLINQIKNKPFNDIENSYTSIKNSANQKAISFRDKMFDTVNKSEYIGNESKDAIKQDISSRIDKILKEYEQVLEEKYTNILKTNRSPEGAADKFKEWEKRESFGALSYSLNDLSAKYSNLAPSSFNLVEKPSFLLPHEAARIRGYDYAPNNISNLTPKKEDVTLINEETQKDVNTLSEAVKNFNNAVSRFQEAENNRIKAEAERNNIFNNIVSNPETQTIKGLDVNSNIQSIKDFLSNASLQTERLVSNGGVAGVSGAELKSLMNFLSRARTNLSYVNSPDKLQGIVDNSSNAYKLRDFFKELNNIDIKNLKDSAASLSEALKLLKIDISPIIDKIRQRDSTFLSNDTVLSRLNNDRIYSRTDVLGNISNRVPEAFQAVKKAEIETENYAKATRDAERELKKLEQSSHRLSRSLDEDILRSLNNGERRFAYNNGFSRVFSLLGGALAKNTENFGHFGETKRRVFNYETKKWESVIDRQGVNLGSLLGGGFGILVSKALAPFFNELKTFFKNSLASFGDIQSLKTNLGVVYGNQHEANDMYEDLSAYALKSPFGVEKVTEFAVLLKQSGVYSTDLLKTLKMIGDVAGGNQTKFQRIANNYAQIVANGKATALDMRQFANAGLPIYKEIEKITGKTTSEIRKMTSEGKLTADIIETVFSNMTQEGGVFYKGVEKGAKTYKAQIQNLSDAKKASSAELGEYFFKFNPFTFYNGEGREIGQGILNVLNDIYESVGGLFKKYNTSQKQNESVNFFKQYTSLTTSLSSIQEKRKTDSNPILAIYEEEIQSAINDLLSKHSFTDEMGKSSAKVKDSVAKNLDKDDVLNKTQKDLLTIKDLLSSEMLGEESYKDLIGISGGNAFTRIGPSLSKYDKIVKNSNFSKENIEKQSAGAGFDIFNIGRSFTDDEKKDILLYKKLLATTSSINTIIQNNKYLKNILAGAIEDERDAYRWDFSVNNVISKSFKALQLDQNKNQQELSKILNTSNGKIYKWLDTSSTINTAAEDTQKHQKKDKETAYHINEQSRQLYDKSSAAKLKEKEELEAKQKKGKDLYEIQQKYGVKATGLDWAGKNGAFFDKTSRRYDIEGFNKLYDLFSSGVAISTDDPSLSVESVKTIKENLNSLDRFLTQSLDDVKDTDLKVQGLKGVVDLRNSLEKYINATTVDEKNKARNSINDVYSNLLNTDGKNSLGYRLKSVPFFRDLLLKTRMQHTNDIFNKDWLNIDDGKKKNTANFRPLWERFSTQSLGIPAQLLSTMNTKDGTNFSKAQKYAGQYFSAMELRNENTAIAKAMLSSGVSPLELASFIKQQDKTVGASFNKTQAVNQGLTNFNLRNFALSAFSNKSVTDAMLNSIGTSLDKIDTFFAGAAFQMEDASMSIEDYSAQLDKSTYDKALQAWNQLGYGYNNINQLKDDIQPFSLSLKNATGEAKTFAEFLPDYLNKYRENLKALQESTARLSAFKEVLTSFNADSFKAKEEQYKSNAAINGGYKTGNESFDNLRYSIQQEVLTRLQSALNSQASLKTAADAITGGQGFSLQMVADLIGKYGTNIGSYSDNADEIVKKLAEENGIDASKLATAKNDSEKQILELTKHTKLLESIYNKLGGDSKDILPEETGTKATSEKQTDKIDKNETLAINIPSFKDMSAKDFAKYLIDFGGVKSGSINKTGLDAFSARGMNGDSLNNLIKLIAESFVDAEIEADLKRKSFESAKTQRDNYFSTILDNLEITEKNNENYEDRIELYKKIGAYSFDNGIATFLEKFSNNPYASGLKLFDEKYKQSRLELKQANSKSYNQGIDEDFINKLEKIVSNSSKTTDKIVPPAQAPAVEVLKQIVKQTPVESPKSLIDNIVESVKAGNSKEYFKDYLKQTDFKADKIYQAFLAEGLSQKDADNFFGPQDIAYGKGLSREEGSQFKYYEQLPKERLVQTPAQEPNVESRVVEAKTVEVKADTFTADTKEYDIAKAALNASSDSLFAKFTNYSKENGLRSGEEGYGIDEDGIVADSKSDYRMFNSFFGGSSVLDIFGLGTKDYNGKKLERHGNLENNKISWNTQSEERGLSYWKDVGAIDEKTKTVGQLKDSFENKIPRMNQEELLNYEKELDSLDIKLEDYYDIQEKTFINGGAEKLARDFANAGDKLSLMKYTLDDLSKLADTFSSTISSGLTSGLSDSLALWGKMVHQSKSHSDIISKLKDHWKDVASSMMQSLGAQITETGLAIAAASAKKGSFSGIAAGLALAASGGIMSFVSGILSDKDDEKDDDYKKQEIQNLKDALSDLIDQAKTDAEYYQKNLTHKNALSANEAISERTVRSVNDAIITPNGSVVTTHPDDYLIATKTPGSLINAGSKNNSTNYSPNITFSVINASGQNVEISTTEQSVDDEGNIDIKATIIAITGEAIASGEFDDAFSAMRYRQQGTASVTG